MIAFRFKIFPVLVLTLLISSFYSCNQTGITDDVINLPPLSIQVKDGGYTNSSKLKRDKLGTEEDGFLTNFQENDQIGLCAVKDNKLVDNITNIRLTAAKDGETLIWDTETHEPLRLTDGLTYFAYYPYTSGLDARLLHPDKTKAADFFADWIQNWNTNQDQSDHTKYTKSDLMIAESTPHNKILNFQMQHAMALVVINFIGPSRYYFTNKKVDSIAPINNYRVEVPPPPLFDKIIPWHTNDYTYRFLVKPNQSSGLITGTYAGVVAKWKADVSNIPYGYYKTYNIGKKDTELKILFNLEPGDYYLKDNNLLKKDFKLDDIFKAAVRGVVFKAGRNTKNFCLDNCQYKLKDGVTDLINVHGYVQAMYDGGDKPKPIDNYFIWGNDEIKVGCNISLDGFYGYSNTQQIKKTCATNPSLTHDLEVDYPATYRITIGYENGYKKQEGDHKAPDNSSGWFFPSIGELGYLYSKKNILETSLLNAGGDAWVSNNYYWSSSEDDGNEEEGSMVLHSSTGEITDGWKSTDGDGETKYYGRAILVF